MKRARPIVIICLTVLIMGSLVVLANPDLGYVAQTFALCVGSASAGILLGEYVDIHLVRMKPQQLDHEGNNAQQEDPDKDETHQALNGPRKGNHRADE